MGKANIPQLDLYYEGKPTDFVVKTMREVKAQYKKGEKEPPHRHSYYTVIWSKNAIGVHYIDFKAHLLEPNTLFFVSPNQAHHVDVEPEPDGFVLLFTQDFLTKQGIQPSFLQGLKLFFACDAVKPLHVHPTVAPRLEQLATAMYEEFTGDELFKADRLGALLKLFFIECRRLKGEDPDDAPIELHRNMNIVRQFKQLVEQQFKQAHKVQDYARQLHLTSNYLNEVVKQETGRSAKDLIKDRIVLEAKRLAVYSEFTSKEVAYQLGFEDPAHFSKFFKNQEGKNFSVLKDEIRKNYK